MAAHHLEGQPRGGRPADRLRPALGPERTGYRWARQLRGPCVPHRALASRRAARRQARRGDRHRLQRDPGRAGDPAVRLQTRYLPAIARVDVPTDGLRLQGTHQAAARALPVAPAARPPGELRFPRARRGGDDGPQLAAAGVSGDRPSADQEGDQGSRAAAQGHSSRRDRVQAGDAHRRLVPDTDQAECRAGHRAHR